MDAPGDRAALLRPLTLGEVFDRAVTLYVRNFVPFTLIALAVIVPMAVLQYFAGLHASATFTQLLAQMQKPGSVPAPAQTGADGLWGFANIFASITLGAFATVAIAAGAGRIYRGERIEWGACYGRAFARTPAILFMLLIEITGLAFVLLAGGMAIGITFGLAIVFLRVATVLAVVAFVFAFAVLVLWLVFLVLCYLAFAFAYNAVGIEGVNMWKAIGSGFSRIFNRGELFRACLVALAFMAIYLGLMVVSVSVAALFESVSLHIINVAVSAAIGLVSMSFLGILIAVYYFDVRVRREGLDLQMQVDSLEGAATAL